MRSRWPSGLFLLGLLALERPRASPLIQFALKCCALLIRLWFCQRAADFVTPFSFRHSTTACAEARSQGRKQSVRTATTGIERKSRALLSDASNAKYLLY